MTSSAPGRYGQTSFTDSAAECGRLAAFAAVCDPYSMRHLSTLAPVPDWRCLEIGPGAGTLARWLASHVAPGEVLAVDRDMVPFGTDIPPNITPLEADVTHTGVLAGLGEFDLVHARAVLMHLPERHQIVRELAARVRPGGHMIITDAFPMPSRAPSRDAMDLVWTQAMRLAGTDPDWARTFPAPLGTCGLVDIHVAIDVPVLRGGDTYARFMLATLRQLGTDADLAAPVLSAYRSLLNDPGYIDWPLAMVTAWGRKRGALAA